MHKYLVTSDFKGFNKVLIAYSGDIWNRIEIYKNDDQNYQIPASPCLYEYYLLDPLNSLIPKTTKASFCFLAIFFFCNYTSLCSISFLT